MQRILITGVSGFIGFHLARRLLSEKNSIIGIDAMIDNNDIWLKNLRLKILKNEKGFRFIEDLVNKNTLKKIRERPEFIIHLAAISGIERFENDKERAERITKEAASAVARYASENKIPVLYASSSSVYGNIERKKFKENMDELRPTSAYAKTKLATEEIFQSVDTCSIGLRFFTVYGEYGRTDMAYFRFAERLLKDEPIILYGRGIKRDLTYIEDVVNAVVLIMKHLKESSANRENLIINIGRGRPISLERVVFLLGKYLNKRPIILYGKPRKFDIPYTCSDNSLLSRITGFTPKTNIDKGLKRFIQWFLHNHQEIQEWI